MSMCGICGEELKFQDGSTVAKCGHAIRSEWRNAPAALEPQRYSFQFNGDVDSCAALADLIRAGWELANVDPLKTDEGFSWIKLQRYVKKAI